MKSFELLELKPLEKPKYFHLKSIHYLQDQKPLQWEMAESLDSVSILLYLQDQESLVLVKQLRPCAYLRDQVGICYELCAGLVDKPNKSLEQIACEEVLEECGYKIAPTDLKKIHSLYLQIGSSPAMQTLFFATITSQQKATQGGGLEDENLEIFLLPTSEITSFLQDDSKPKTATLAYMLEWFMRIQKENK